MDMFWMGDQRAGVSGNVTRADVLDVTNTRVWDTEHQKRQSGTRLSL